MCFYTCTMHLCQVMCLKLLNRSISELIHLARWVKFNPRFNPGLALIGVCRTQFNNGLNFNPGLGDLSLVLRNRFEVRGLRNRAGNY